MALDSSNEAPSFGKLCAALKQRQTNRYVPLTVEAMALEYLKATKARQPTGPYCLCGYSFGGLVAFEMARQLQESGDSVRFVGLFDTVPSLRFARAQLAQLISGVISAPVYRWPSESWRAGARILALLRDHLRQRQSGEVSVPAFVKSAPASVLKVGIAALLASARYRPRFYAGELTFAPASRDCRLACPQATWHRYSRSLRVFPTAGGHLTMLSPENADTAAASLSRALALSHACARRAKKQQTTALRSLRQLFTQPRKIEELKRMHLLEFDEKLFGLNAVPAK